MIEPGVILDLPRLLQGGEGTGSQAPVWAASWGVPSEPTISVTRTNWPSSAERIVQGRPDEIRITSSSRLQQQHSANDCSQL